MALKKSELPVYYVPCTRATHYHEILNAALTKIHDMNNLVMFPYQ